MEKIKVDINCDMGESFGLYELGNDEEMMKFITSANIACGFHAGDPHVMEKTIRLAKEYEVSVGAHPGFPDILGFGRRDLACTPQEIKDYVIYQVGALKEFAKIHELSLQHIKPHGALYMKAMEDEKIAKAMLEAISSISKEAIVFALNNSAVAYVGEKMGVPIAKEVYADREHKTNGFNVLTRKGSVIDDYKKMAYRAVRMVKEGKVIANTGDDVNITAHTVCIHGDTPGAPLLAKSIIEQLHESGIEVTSIKNII